MLDGEGNPALETGASASPLCRGPVGFSPHSWLLPPSQLIYLPPPWGDCKAAAGDSEFYDTYSITACRIDCETRYLVENCNCRMVHMPGEPHMCQGPAPPSLSPPVRSHQENSAFSLLQAMPLTAPRSSTRSARIRP